MTDKPMIKTKDINNKFLIKYILIINYFTTKRSRCDRPLFVYFVYLTKRLAPILAGAVTYRLNA
jgi:hypothetical protein